MEETAGSVHRFPTVAGNENGAFKMWVFNYQRNVRSVGRRVLTWRNFLDVKFRIEKTLVMNDLYRGLESVFYLAVQQRMAAAQPAWTRENIKLHCICNPGSILGLLCPGCPVSCNEDDIIMTASHCSISDKSHHFPTDIWHTSLCAELRFHIISSPKHHPQ